jgi:hypothetical protein
MRDGAGPTVCWSYGRNARCWGHAFCSTYLRFCQIAEPWKEEEEEELVKKADSDRIGSDRIKPHRKHSKIGQTRGHGFADVPKPFTSTVAEKL